jgi:vacuolar-type H+-ATPase subunit E/Vma4
MRSEADRTHRALAPLRQELLRAAHADAEAEVAAARQAAEEEVAAARAEADRVLAAARDAGAREGAAAAVSALVLARSRARARELAARSELLDALRQEVAERLLAVRNDAGWADLQAALALRARALLGPDAAVTELPDGGVVATVPGRRVDLSLTALADAAVGLSAAAVERLWTP